jgi:Protein of unknown function (DUF2911)
MSGRRGPVGPVVAALLLGLPSGCGGQGEIPKSQHARVEQQVGPLEVVVEYSRPVARGRRLFGGIVPFGEPWNPGADDATRIDFSRAVEIEGRAVPAGSYSIWLIPGQTEWTFILSRAARVYHIPYPEGRDQLRLSVTPSQGPHLETLAFDFPLVDADSAVLRFHWGTTILPLRLRAGREG